MFVMSIGNQMDQSSFTQVSWQCFLQPKKLMQPKGNEADVTLYLNSTGLMWETAPKFGALLVFAEHRYFGKSVPYGKDVMKHMTYLSSSQALADYATLIRHTFIVCLRSLLLDF